MGRSKDLFMEMMEGLLWDTPLLRMKQLLEKYDTENAEQLEEEKFEVVKGDYKTLITCKFNKKGYLVSCISESELVEKPTTTEDLNKLLAEAVEKQDFVQAAKIKKQIDNRKIKTN